MGVLYILDEPSIGLHPRDHARLLQSLERLRDAKNSVVVVEHDEATIRRADFVVDMGPGAGVHGGEVVAAGTPAEIAAHPRSETGAWLSGRRRLATPRLRPVRGRPAPRAVRLPRAQPEERHARDPARALHGGERRLGLGQVHAGLRHAAPRAGEEAARRRGGARQVRAPDRRRAARQGDRDRPVADRPHAAQQSRHLHRRLRRRSQAVQPGARGARARLRPRALLLQREGRALRVVRRRRRAQGRDALPARPLRDLRGVRWRALQPRDARGALQGQEHRRGAGHQHRRGARAVRERAVAAPSARDARRGRARLPPARPAGDDLVGRRGAAHQARARAVAARDRAARSTCSTSRPRACTSPTSRSCSACSSSSSSSATACW